MRKSLITIIIPTFNSEKYVKNCLDSIFAQSFKGFEVVIFDNGSKDRTVEILKKYPVKIIQSKNNVGWAKANNICIKQAKTKYVFLLNIDTILDANCLGNLYEFSESKGNLACVSPRIVEYSEFIRGEVKDGYPLCFDIKEGVIKAFDIPKNYTEASFVPGTALFANKENLKDKFYFKEIFYMYHEDVEFGLRILAQTNLKLYFLSTAIVAHDSKQSFSRVSTCRLALRNLFTCLKIYQTEKEFLKNYGRYCKNLFSLYKNFYWLYYPFTYPLFSLYYLISSLFRQKKEESYYSKRLVEINKQLSKYPEKFKFIF